jgi:hypothetical protein
MIDWSNFEIADMDFWRAPAYTAFFNYLDTQGGFYYEVRHWCMTSSLSLNNRVNSSAGEMHPFTALQLHFSHAKTKYNSLRKLGISMMIGVTAHLRTIYGIRVSVLVIKNKVSVCYISPLRRVWADGSYF